MRKLFILSFLIFIVLHGFAQKQEKITYDQVKTQCASMALAKRARLAVTRFNVTTTSVNDDAAQQTANTNNSLKALSMLMGGGGNAPKADAIPLTLGDNLATTLRAALQGISCFRVLESHQNDADLDQEIDGGNSKYSSKNAPKAGKQLGAQIVATGEVIEYSVKQKGLNIGGVGTSKKLVKIGFVLNLVNPETRDVIATRKIRVQSKSGASVSVLGMVSTSNDDPAIAAVVDDGVFQAVQYLVHVRDSLNITVDNIPGNAIKNPNVPSEIVISLSNANFGNFNDVAKIVATLPGFQSMEKSLASGTGTYTVTHLGSADDFLSALNNKLGSKYEVMGFTSDEIDVKVK